MPTEVVIAHIKPDSASWEGYSKEWSKVAPVLRSQKGVQHCYYGFIVEEDGKVIENDLRFVLFVDWHQFADFQTFVSSADFGPLFSSILPFASQVDKPQVYDTNLSPAASAEAPLTQIVRTKIGDSAGAAAAVEEAWKALVAALEGVGTGNPVHITHGKSLNMDEACYVSVLGWGDEEARTTNEEVEGSIAELRKIGETSVIVTQLVDFDVPMKDFPLSSSE